MIFNIEDYLSLIKINKGDKILLNSNILKILIKIKKDGNLINPNRIIDFFIEKIGKKGTLLIPTYNWDFCKGIDFDYCKTKSRTGALSNICLKRNDFKRSRNPIYSFAVFGKDQKKICELKHNSCFALDSPFGYLLKNKGKNISIGIDYISSNTFVHVAEEIAQVEYRLFKEFKGIYIDKFDKKKTETYKMYVRKANLVKATIHDKSLENILIKNNILEKKIYNKIVISSADIHKSHKFMLDDIKKKRQFIYPEMI